MAKTPNTDSVAENGQLAHATRNGKPVKELLQVRAKQLKESEGIQLPDDDLFRTRYPALWELMMPQRVRAASKLWDRRPPTLTVVMDNGGWRATVRDNDMQMSCTVFSLTFEALLPALELGVCDPRAWLTFKARGRGLKEARE